MVRQYIGARYVTKIYENSLDPSSAEWESGVTYEPLTLVTYNNGSYLSKKEVPGSIGNPAANPTFWVQTGFYNGQITNLQNQIDIINANLSNYITDNDAAVKKVKDIALTGRKLDASLVLSDLYNYVSFPYNLQGGCYVKNNYFVVYFNSETSNTGVLRCYNLATHTEVWSYTMELYHGNSVTFNPNNDMLYVSGCITYDGTYINMIFEIDWDNPSVINRTIILPDTTYNLSLAYDTEGRKFYGRNDVINELNVYNEDLTELLETITLEMHPAVDYDTPMQGPSAVHDGIIYDCSYESFNIIVGWDVKTGKVVSINNLPDLISECRYITEMEAVMYDYEHDKFYMLSTTDRYNLCLRTTAAVNIAEINLTHDIVYRFLRPFVYDTANRHANQLTVINNKTSIKPDFLDPEYASYAQCFGDVINYMRKHGGCEVTIDTTSPDPEIWIADLSDLNLTVNGRNFAEFFRLDMRNTNARFLRCKFTGTMTLESVYNYNVCMLNSRAYFDSCIFEEPDANTHTYHLANWNNCVTVTDYCTFNGTVDADVHTLRSFLNGTYT